DDPCVDVHATSWLANNVPSSTRTNVLPSVSTLHSSTARACHWLVTSSPSIVHVGVGKVVDGIKHGQRSGVAPIGSICMPMAHIVSVVHQCTTDAWTPRPSAPPASTSLTPLLL
ncbi:hypothetical protein L7F22_009458, partial [Adiantum nelumboides]|nr:hypothetical protein [Adiantum nelumboides]